jgi:hypothetical protein
MKYVSRFASNNKPFCYFFSQIEAGSLLYRGWNLLPIGAHKLSQLRGSIMPINGITILPMMGLQTLPIKVFNSPN